ncbi:MAG: hypothetical protein JO227_18150 [Acetobacteraceae bacterium]|nr:hypothetical protein [Acetobacteraceae bacterium]
MARALLVVRAVVLQTDRSAFDVWYSREHLPDAMKAFQVRRAWRAWSRTEPGVHCAVYEFNSADAAEAVNESDVVKPLVAEFDRRWGSSVTRSREVLEIVDEQGERSA